MTEIQAIETRYNGYRFRSRLEARWAVFLDTLQIKYQYEVQGYVLSNGNTYLPDFYIPKQLGVSKSPFFVEIKGERPDYCADCAYLAGDTGINVYMFFSDIPYPNPSDADTESAEAFGYPLGSWDNRYWWCRCAVCGNLGIEFEGEWGRLDCNHASRPYSDISGNYRSPHHDILERAYEAARSARFEFGKNGGTR